MDKEPYLNVEIPPIVLARLHYILRLEQLTAVGCVYRMGDLAPKTWDELIVLKQERDWITRKIYAKDDPPKDGLTLEQRNKVSEERVKLKLPPPGGTLFPQSKPIR